MCVSNVCVCVRIMACLFICRLTLVRPLLLISDPASLFRSPPSWPVMKTLLLERQAISLKTINAQFSHFTGVHSKIFTTSFNGTDVVSVKGYLMPLSLPLVHIFLLCYLPVFFIFIPVMHTVPCTSWQPLRSHVKSDVCKLVELVMYCNSSHESRTKHPQCCQ